MSIATLYEIYTRFPLISTDTRKIVPGSIFFALKGENFDGNSFVDQALEAGAAYAVTDEPANAGKERCILVDDVLTALQLLANYHRKYFTVPFVAITGSNGKTTTKELVLAVLSKKYKTYATEGNLNNHIGVPLTLLKIGKDAEMAVIEMGANHQMEIASYCIIAEPTHGIITNCGKAHIEGFGGEEGVRKGKGELFDYLRDHNGLIFRNTDLAYLSAMAGNMPSQITYGSSNAQFVGRPSMDGIFLTVSFDYEGVSVNIKTRVVGAYNFANVMTAIAVGLYFKVSAQQIKEAIESYQPDNSRSQWLQKGTNQVILDAYNANPTSMKAAISNFAAAALDNKLLWIGGMKEMGDAELHEHIELVKLISEFKWQEVILVGKEFAGVDHNFRWFEDSAAAADYVAANAPQNSAILIKGSRGSRMERLVEAL